MGTCNSLEKSSTEQQHFLMHEAGICILVKSLLYFYKDVEERLERNQKITLYHH